LSQKQQLSRGKTSIMCSLDPHRCTPFWKRQPSLNLPD
jgi:hypothetical protein